jgi:hypothetical protein
MAWVINQKQNYIEITFVFTISGRKSRRMFSPTDVSANIAVTAFAIAGRGGSYTKLRSKL